MSARDMQRTEEWYHGGPDDGKRTSASVLSEASEVTRVRDGDRCALYRLDRLEPKVLEGRVQQIRHYVFERWESQEEFERKFPGANALRARGEG